MSAKDETRVASPITVGEIFAGRYRVEAELGAGGMSVVYKAADTLAQEQVALKVMEPGMARDPRLAKQFKRELASARKVAHPNIVRIHDIGEAEGSLFISMEFVDGRTVADRLAADGPFSFGGFLPLFEQICDALAAVHRAGMVHRDVKPLNIMIDRTGAAKLMDFGIAAAMEGDDEIAAGTPAYMAPELAAGEPATPASDIYSAGVTFFEMLTGGKPAGGEAEISGVPQAVAEVVLRAIRRNPAERFQSVAEMMAAVRKLSVDRARKPPTLAGYLSDDPAPVDEVLPVFVAVLEAAAASGGAATLTPDCIRIASDGSASFASTAAKQNGTVAPANAKYSAPEIFTEASPASRAAMDAYALGFMFYEILLGRRLFERTFAACRTDVEWLRWHASREQSAPPAHQLAASIPAAVSETLAAMIDKRIEARLCDLREAANRLKPLARKVEKTVVHPMEKARERRPGREKQARRRVWKRIAAGFALAGVLAGVAGAGWVAWRSLPEAPDPPAPPPAPKPVELRMPQLPDSVETPTGVMQFVPAGEFTMGADAGRQSEQYGYFNESPSHAVFVRAFYLDKIEVTNALYRKFCGATSRPYPKPPEGDPHYFEQDGWPVLNISWQDASDFARWAKKRLPTEAEWEKAARGTDTRRFPWGNQWLPPHRPEGGLFGAVGAVAHDRSPYGVLDLAGNVPEWVEDTYRLYPGNPGVLPVSEQAQKVVRGVWFDLDPRIAAITNRGSADPEPPPGRTYHVGFRCAMDVETAIQSGGTQK